MGEKEEFIKFGGEKCIDCGLCSFACPSNIEIAQTIKMQKHLNSNKNLNRSEESGN